MQHKIIFTRHWHLKGKYSDYSCLSFEDMRDLGINKEHYRIDTSDMPSDIRHLSVSDLCYTSFQNRAVETANSLGFTLSKKSSSLDEIYFDLFELMTEEQYRSKGGLNFVRIALWQAFFERKTGVESPESVMTRIQSFLTEVSVINERNITVISHGFYLQMVKCFLLKGVDFTKISYKEFLDLDIKPLDYLESFEVNLNS